MSSDEWLERLGQRVDALTQSVELLASMHRDSEKRFDEFRERTTTIVERLTDIVSSHERRLNGLEGSSE